MRSKKVVDTKKLDAGEILHESFDNYVAMAENAVDWTLFCPYQLKPSFSDGHYRILQLPSMQIVFTQMSGGVMFDYVAPEGCVIFSVLKEVAHKACIDEMKLESGMIAITDDTKKYNFLCSDSVSIFDIAIKKEAYPQLAQRLTQAVDRYYLDPDAKISAQIEALVQRHTTTTIDGEAAALIEAEIIHTIHTVLDAQQPQTPHFTPSQRVALKIKKQLFSHMDHTISIETFAREYDLSVKSLQNAFRSLFGITPNTFIRLLKLNLVHHELIQSDASQTSVQKVAQKWGFRHMGRFSRYYTDLFGENPSVTLKTANPLIDGMNTHCVERKEEMV